MPIPAPAVVTLRGRLPSMIRISRIENAARCSSYFAWKCGGACSLKYMAITIPKNLLISGIVHSPHSTCVLLGSVARFGCDVIPDSANGELSEITAGWHACMPRPTGFALERFVGRRRAFHFGSQDFFVAGQCTLNTRWELGGHHLLPVNLAPVDNERSVTNSVNRALLLACGIDVCGNRL